MKKRLKKKITNRYNALNGARRQRDKRKGVKCISYAFLPIGERDKAVLAADETIPDYSFASHWLIEAYAWQDFSQVRIFPCTEDGGTISSSPLQMFVFEGEEIKRVLSKFKKAVKAMENDGFRENYG
ncbi:hypothetical protein H1Q58_15455 [Planococcus maritimus]|uniref:Uncharacterized protein n=1 Tax=Planococcus maritimus TaxID=192421 RepID=A0A7D7MG81_PLAMR|nr:hypothetical protein [Planococcus maritimus]QMT17327.1 hypothetical protein H1Q58_15455 [Planococcus maritimus]